MNPRLAATLAVACFALPLGPSHARETQAIPTAVLVDQSLTDLHYLAPKSDIRYMRAGDVVVPQTDFSTGGIVGGALGAAIGTALVNAEMRKSAQRQANMMLTPVVEPLGKTGLQGPLRQAFAAALPRHGMEQATLVFTGGAKLDRKHFVRMPAAQDAGRFVLVGYGEGAKDILMMPVALHDSQRQLRLALDIEVREGSAARNSRVLKRDVIYYSQTLPLPEGARPLDVLAADDQAALRRELADAVAATLAMVHQEREFPDVGKDAEIGVVTDLGLTEFEGVLLEETQGRMLLWTRGGSYVSIPSGQVITGEALVAARETETERPNTRKPWDPDIRAPLDPHPLVAPDAEPAAESAPAAEAGADAGADVAPEA